MNSVELTSSILENMSGIANKEFNLSIHDPTVDNPMRPPDTSTSLTNDQYNGNQAHSIINEERPLNANSAKQSLNNQNNNVTVT